MQVTHVVLGRTAPLLHVHHLDVQHGAQLHLHPAKALHGGACVRPRGSGQLTLITAEKSPRASPVSANGSALRTRDATSIRSDPKLIDGPSERVPVSGFACSLHRLSRRRAVTSQTETTCGGCLCVCGLHTWSCRRRGEGLHARPHG